MRSVCTLYNMVVCSAYHSPAFVDRAPSNVCVVALTLDCSVAATTAACAEVRTTHPVSGASHTHTCFLPTDFCVTLPPDIFCDTCSRYLLFNQRVCEPCFQPYVAKEQIKGPAPPGSGSGSAARSSFAQPLVSQREPTNGSMVPSHAFFLLTRYHSLMCAVQSAANAEAEKEDEAETADEPRPEGLLNAHFTQICNGLKATPIAMGHPPAFPSTESGGAGDWRFAALHQKVHNLQALLERRASMLTLMSLVVRCAFCCSPVACVHSLRSL
jgi:hypothetical protein